MQAHAEDRLAERTQLALPGPEVRCDAGSLLTLNSTGIAMTMHGAPARRHHGNPHGPHNNIRNTGTFRSHQEK